MIWSKEVDSVLNAGLNLESIGVRNWALDQTSLSLALLKLEALGVAVLGGDVYTICGVDVQPNYDSWHCNRNAGEDNSEFVKRSIATAKNYIANYHADQGAIVFAVVPNIVLV